jgi:hypothetical protein
MKNTGDGQADVFSLIVDDTDLLEVDGKIINTNLIDFNGNELNGVYNYTAKNYDFNEHSIIGLVYSNKAYRKQNYMEKIRLEEDVIKQVKASSTLEEKGIYDYYLSNIFDEDLETCWAKE